MRIDEINRDGSPLRMTAELIELCGRVTVRDVFTQCLISEAQATRRMRRLIELGLVECVGFGAGVSVKRPGRSATGYRPLLFARTEKPMPPPIVLSNGAARQPIDMVFSAWVRGI